VKVGTRSLLIGVHQFIWHPITVYMAWKWLYGRPSFKELICIIIHDWGYWGSPDMDGKVGSNHPEKAALMANKWFGCEYFYLCLYHSRNYAKRHLVKPSKLCYADKLSIMYELKWFYLLRAKLSGELKLYRYESADLGQLSLEKSDEEWFDWIQPWYAEIGARQKEECF